MALFPFKKMSPPDPEKQRTVTDRVLSFLPVFLLVLLVGGYQLHYFNRYMPHNDGWFQYYALLMQQGKFPYRDFLVYCQPLYLLFIQALHGVFGPALIVTRTYGALETVLFMAVGYTLLARSFSRLESFIAAVLMAFLYNYDLFLPYLTYTNTCATLFLISGWLFLKITDAPCTANTRYYFVLLGALCALSFWMVQSLGAMTLIFYLLAISLYYGRTAGFKTVVVFLLFFLLPFVLLSLIVLFWLHQHQALGMYVQQVFVSTGKGKLSQALFRCFLPANYPFPAPTWWCILGPILIYCLYAFLPVPDFRLNRKLGAAIGFLRKHEAWCFGLFGLLFFLAYRLPFALEIRHVQAGVENFVIRCIEVSSIFACYVCLFILLRHFFLWFKTPVDRPHFHYWFIAALFFTILYGRGLSGSLHVSATAPPFALVSLYLLQSVRSAFLRRMLKVAWAGGVLCIVAFVAMMRFTTPYSWWGGYEPRVQLGYVQLNIPRLKHIYLSPPTARLYREVCSCIQTSSKPMDEVYFFPHLAIFNVLTERTNSCFVPIAFFDVCPDAAALQAAEYLQSKKPQLIVWMRLQENVWTTHEKMYREGKPSGQRQIVATIEELKARGDYVVVYQSREVGGYDPIEILMRKADAPAP